MLFLSPIFKIGFLILHKNSSNGSIEGGTEGGIKGGIKGLKEKGIIVRRGRRSGYWEILV